MFSISERAARQNDRLSISLPVRVEAHEPKNKIWREVTHLESVSENGAGFYLSRLFEVGQLIFLSMPVEKALRRHDLDKENYNVWTIVRHCYRTIRSQSSVYHTGVAFIGQEAPFSHKKDPTTIYKLGEIKDDGFWRISEEAKLPSKRAQSRYTIPIDVYIAVCDEQNNIIAHESTVTENISVTGASVFSGLDIKIGDKVKFTNQHSSFSAMAIVRNRRVGEDNLPRLHLEFINVRFPLEGID